MSWDDFQRTVLAELGLAVMRHQPAGSEPAPPPDPRVLAILAKALRIAPQALLDSGIALPSPDRLRDPAVKRALWPGLRRLLAG